MTAWIAANGTKLIAQSAARGAEPQLFAATAPGVKGGDYFGPKGQYRGHTAPSRMSESARSLPDAQRLWNVPEQLTGIEIDTDNPCVALGSGQAPHVEARRITRPDGA